jgi:hypothetical protein
MVFQSTVLMVHDLELLQVQNNLVEAVELFTIEIFGEWQTLE